MSYPDHGLPDELIKYSIPRPRGTVRTKADKANEINK